MTEVELKPGGSDISVTCDNLEEFIQLKAEYRVVGQVAEQRLALRRGFSSVWGRQNMTAVFGALSPRELELVMHGLPTINLDDWRRNTRYRSNYSETSMPVRFFWRVLESYDDEMRAAVL
eukprot:SAG31_NODE_32221_length_358_cov_1.173745_1_plen_119_part_11